MLQRSLARFYPSSSCIMTLFRCFIYCCLTCLLCALSNRTFCLFLPLSCSRYHSRWDTSSTSASHLCQVASLTARTLYRRAGGMTTAGLTMSADCKLVRKQERYCLIGNCFRRSAFSLLPFDRISCICQRQGGITSTSLTMHADCKGGGGGDDECVCGYHRLPSLIVILFFFFSVSGIQILTSLFLSLCRLSSCCSA